MIISIRSENVVKNLRGNSALALRNEKGWAKGQVIHLAKKLAAVLVQRQVELCHDSFSLKDPVVRTKVCFAIRAGAVVLWWPGF